MKLFEIMNGIQYEVIQGNDIEIESLSIDSRVNIFNGLFFCIKGFSVDGHSFIKNVVLEGVAAIVIDSNVDWLPSGITILKVANSREALSIAAGNFYNNPTHSFNLAGFTGTNGKTSSTYFLEAVLQACNKRVGIIGTVGAKICSKEIDIKFATSTTPDPIELQQIFSEMRNERATDVIMEVTSHALMLSKVHGLRYKVAVLTNLTQDHLDVHGTMQDYRNEKAKLFKMCDHAVINIDDEHGKFFVEISECPVMTYGIDNPNGDLKVTNILNVENGTEFDVNIFGKTEHFFIPIKGKFSIYNCLGVIGASLVLNVPIELTKESLSKMKGIPGRIQSIQNDRGINVIVDYAHTPDGIKNIASAVREFTDGKLITVFGCGGDRDKTKRPIMGKTAVEFSDYCIITSDNPRTEDPASILVDIEEDILDFPYKYEKIVDREEAIQRAIFTAERGDSIILAGKGHENYQIFADRTIHFDDAEIVKKYL